MNSLGAVRKILEPSGEVCEWSGSGESFGGMCEWRRSGESDSDKTIMG